MFSAESKIKKIYRSPKSSIYAHRFFSDLSSYYSLGSSKQDFLSFAPNDCKLENLLKRQEIESTIRQIAYSLIAYGRAYLYLHPIYSVNAEDDGTQAQPLSSVEIGEIKGLIKKKTSAGYLFCGKCFDEKVEERHIVKNQLVLFDIKELGFSKKYFSRILRKLAKCDITSQSTDMLTNHPEIYDFVYHSEKKKLAELKASKKIGWSFGTEKLSDSYIMFKKIQEDELKISFIDYIVRRINEGLHGFLGGDSGELVVHIDRKDYKDLWDKYLTGKITGTELSKKLYNH